MNENKMHLKRAIKYFGNQKKLANFLSRTQPTISYWLNNENHDIPIKLAKLIEKHTKNKIKLKQLRSDLFDK